MSERALRAGLIGCGKMGTRSHVPSLDRLGIELVAVCDTEKMRAEAIRSEYDKPDLTVYTSHEELIRHPGLDLVVVATPPFLHMRQSVAAMEAGLHVACEKPAVMNVAEARRIHAVSQRTKRHIAFFSARMRGPEYHATMKAIEGGRIGELHMVEVRWVGARGRPGIDRTHLPVWFTQKKTAGGGVLYDLGQYHLDYTLEFLGWPEVRTVTANWEHSFPIRAAPERSTDLEGHIHFLARFDDGPILRCYQANYANQPFENYARIIGSEGEIRMDRRAGVTLYRRGAEEDDAVVQESLELPQGIPNGNDIVIGGLRDAIIGTARKFGTNAGEALYLTELCQMAYRSSELGREVSRAECLSLWDEEAPVEPAQ